MDWKDHDAKIRELAFCLERLSVSIDPSSPTAMTLCGKDPPQWEEKNDEILRLEFGSDSSSPSSMIQGEVMEGSLQDVKYPTSNHRSFPPIAESQSGDETNSNRVELDYTSLNVPQRDNISNLDYFLDFSSWDPTSLPEIGDAESQNDKSLNFSPLEPIADVGIEVSLNSELSCDYTQEESNPRTQELDLSEKNNEVHLSPINAARPHVEEHTAIEEGKGEPMEIDTAYNNAIHYEKIVGLDSYERVGTTTPVPSTRSLEPEEGVIGGRSRPSYASMVRNELGGGVWSNRRSQQTHSKPLLDIGRRGRQGEATEKPNSDPPVLPVSQDNSRTPKMPVKKNEGLMENLGPTVRQLMDTELETGRKLRAMKPKPSPVPRVSTNSRNSYLKEAPAVLTEKVQHRPPNPEEPVQELHERTTKRRTCPPLSGRSRGKVVCEIVILFDDSKPMFKFLSPFVDNMKTFWDLLSQSDKEFRIALVTPCRSFHFTSDRGQFLSFVESIKVQPDIPHDKSNGDHCSSSGLIDALSKLDEVCWDASSESFVYIVTNMPACDDKGDDTRDMKLCKSFRRMKSCLPAESKVCIGSWLQDNDLLLRSLKSERIVYFEFGILDVQTMASHIVNDKYLIKALCMSKVPERTPIKICEGPKGKSAMPWLRGTKQGPVDCRAKRSQVVPLESIQEISSRPGFKSQLCWMKRETKPARVTNGMVHYHGQLRHGRFGECDGSFIFKSLKIDAITYGSSVGSRERYESQAFVSAIAQFLASQYNDGHRPEHCSKVAFLKGFIVEEASAIDDANARVFYIEPRLQDVSLRVYCDKSGTWLDPSPDESLLRFAQMCFKLSGGDFMLAGFRGYYRSCSNTFVLSVPTLLHRASMDEHINGCNKEYVTVYRKKTKELLSKIELEKNRRTEARNGSSAKDEGESRREWSTWRYQYK